jgi:hypothetical protein
MRQLNLHEVTAATKSTAAVSTEFMPASSSMYSSYTCSTADLLLLSLTVFLLYYSNLLSEPAKATL